MTRRQIDLFVNQCQASERARRRARLGDLRAAFDPDGKAACKLLRDLD